MAEHLPAAPESHEIRVFLSSTFRDFNEERKLLATEVFPELNRRARERGVELVEVDLRWGVTQQQAEGGHALGICLQEIERCKPYFIGMLGDSYGSLTPPQRQLLQAEPALLEERSWLEGQIGSASYTELEIQHGLALLLRRQREQQEGHAFFYFRDPAYSDAKADAGEAGWRSDDPGDRQKLEQLRDRIRSSGYPLVEGLKNPKAIADQIKEDLWGLIERLFPEGEQPDALQKEERKHADYRRSRTKPDQYVGGGGYIDQLESWLAEDQQQILITGESGAGKSALIANWIERHAQSHPDDLVYAHHLGCTNDANALRPLLGRLIDTASQQLLEAEVIGEALTVPEDWWEMVAKVAETLQSLGRWCEQQGKRWIWVLDGLDRLDLDDQKAFPWLPLNLPAGVQVVASALACPAREILSERGYTTLTIQPLEEKEQEQLIQRYLQRYTKELDGGLRQQILDHPLAGSPLFLKVLLEELRQCGRHDTLKQQLEFYLSSKTVDDLYERVLERLETDGSGEAVKKVMAALWASRAGLTEPELLAISDLKPLQWAPIDLALEKAFGRNGNRLVFDHDYLRIAVQDRYLPTEEQQRQAHSAVADWFGAPSEWDERKAEEWPWQLQEGGRTHDLRELLLSVSDLYELARKRDDREVINYWRIAKGEGDGELDELIGDAVKEEIEKRNDQAEDQMSFVDCIAALLNEAGLYRELLLNLRTLSLDLEEATEDQDEESMLNSLAWLANAHKDMGHYDEAERLFLRCLEARERLLGFEHQDTLSIVNNLANLFSDLSRHEQAECLYHRCLSSSERLLGPEHPDSLTFMNNLGVLSCRKGDYKQAEDYYKRCLNARERLLGVEHPETITTLNNLGVLYSNTRKYCEAEFYLQRCLHSSEGLLGSEHPNTISTVENLARVYEELGDADEAEAYYSRCLEARERLLGAEHPDTNYTKNSLANLLSDRERYAESIPLRRQELDVAAKWDGRDAPDTLTSIHRLAEDLYWADELEESAQLYREALSGRIAALGDDDGATMASRYGLARCLSEQEHYGEAIELRRVELAWLQAAEDMDIVNMLISMHGLGCDLLSAGETEEALEVLQSCLSQRQQELGAGDDDTLGTLARVFEVLSSLDRQREGLVLSQSTQQALTAELGENDPKVFTLLSNQAYLHDELGELEQAEALYRRCLSGREEVLGTDHSSTLSTAYNLAEVLSQQDRRAEAIPLRRRELTWCRKQNGDTDPGTLTSINGLAIDLRETGALEEAEALFREQLAARQQLLEPSDFGIGRALGRLAETLELAGKLEEAAGFAQQALEHRLEHEGADDWWTNRERLDLARVLQKLGRNSEAVPLLDELLASVGRNNEPDDDDRQLLADAEGLMRSLDEGL